MIPSSSVRKSQGIDLELNKTIMVLGLFAVPCMRHLLISQGPGPTSAIYSNTAASYSEMHRLHPESAGICNLPDNFSSTVFTYVQVIDIAPE